MEVHSALGPGLLESTYRACLAHQLSLNGMRCETEVAVPIPFKGMSIECACRADLIVDDSVVVELKCVEVLAPAHQAQLLTYMKHAGLAVGLLINLNVRQLRHGIRRFTRRR